MIVLPQNAFAPGQIVSYEKAAYLACEKLGIHPDTLMPVLPNGWELYGKQHLRSGTAYTGPNGQAMTLELYPVMEGPGPQLPAWQVMARYIEINRAVLFALQETGCPSTITPGN